MRNWVGGAAVGAVLMTAACGGGETFALDGQVVLESADNVVGEEDGQEACRGGGGYADIIGGEDVIVFDQGGEEVARTELEQGLPEDGGQTCVFPFAVSELPEADGYAIVIANREPVPYTLDELRESDFAISLTLSDEAL
ncbi:MAG: hypothetical protein H0U10_05965 [Chloroflexia bacterium]|nr:hypothetical protein [Chloroflexia bacterium]